MFISSETGSTVINTEAIIYIECDVTGSPADIIQVYLDSGFKLTFIGNDAREIMNEIWKMQEGV